MKLLAIAAFAALLHNVLSQQQALFVKNEILEQQSRPKRQSNADQMVQNILQWLHGVYSQNNRKIRQGNNREYLPPSNTQKPRPFETPSTSTQGYDGYPPAGSITPQPPFPGYPSPSGGGASSTTEFTGYQRPGTTGYPSQPGYSTQRPGYSTQRPGFPSSQTPGYQGSTGYPGSQSPGYTQPTGFPSSQTPGYTGPQNTGYDYNRPTGGFPGSPTTSTGYPGSQTPAYTRPTQGYPSSPSPGYSRPTQGSTPGYSRPTPGYPGTTGYPGTQTPGYPSSTGYPSTSAPEGQTNYPSSTPGYPSSPSSYPGSQTPGYQGQTPGYQGQTPGYQGQTPGYQGQTPGYQGQTPGYQGQSPGYQGQTPGYPGTSEYPGQTSTQQPSYPGGQPSYGGQSSTITPVDDNDLRHPPHIHSIDVQCSKEMMTINIEFNREFNGIIYSKGYFNMPECRYVNENSGQTKYVFTVSLNSCGTEFINGFDTQGQSYLENVLVFQNEAGIQEVWDTIRSVRCLWEGNLKESLNVALSVGMLNEEIVTFSGDTAMAKLDIQLGKGPFAQPANGLIKIGEIMTLVVSVTGDAGFDIQVKDCRATDSTGANVVPLTDENGCVLKPKLFGAFQKTRDTGNTGASIIAYAFFSAFKFPDVMDLLIECNVDLCKTDCQMCPDPNQKIDPGRRRKRDLDYYKNQTIEGPAITMGKHLKVILPEDLSGGGGDSNTIINLDQGICMSTPNFLISSAILIIILISSSLISARLWLKNQNSPFKS